MQHTNDSRVAVPSYVELGQIIGSKRVNFNWLKQTSGLTAIKCADGAIRLSGSEAACRKARRKLAGQFEALKGNAGGVYSSLGMLYFAPEQSREARFQNEIGMILIHTWVGLHTSVVCKSQ